MRVPTLGERAMFVAAIIGVVLGALFLFAPIHGYCISSVGTTAPPPGSTPGPLPTAVTTCGSEALWQRQPIFPLPFFAVVVWSLAPALGYYGARMGATSATMGPGRTLVILGLVVEATVLISFGAAPFFVPFVFLPQLIASMLALRGS